MKSIIAPVFRRMAAPALVGLGRASAVASSACSSTSCQHRHQSGDGGVARAEHPIIQLPARSLWCRQFPVSIEELNNGMYNDLINKVKAARKYYQYPSMSAPQIGWNARMFTLFDDEVYINPEIVSTEKTECWCWEPCASCAFLMHFIKRPKKVTIKYVTTEGKEEVKTFEKMRARMVQHEMDHLDGVLFTRRIPDTHHVVPLDGFNYMSDWPDDYPSLEARSTFMYTTFTPPYSFETDEVVDSNMLDRKFEDGVYPGHEHDMAVRINTTAHMETQREMWMHQKAKYAEEVSGDVPTTMPDVVPVEEEEATPAAATPPS